MNTIHLDGAEPSPDGPELIEGLAVLVTARRERVEALRLELKEVESELIRYEKALSLLRGEPRPKSTTYNATAKRKQRASNRGVLLADEKLKRIERFVRQHAADHEEFRQVDIRTGLDMTSSTMTTAFEKLRQANVIRLARIDGNNKWFRLTREAVHNGSDQ